MFGFIIAVITLIFLIIVLVLAGFFLLAELIAMVQTKGVPYVSSFDDDLKVLKDKLKIDLSGKSLLDLGCGDGKALRFFSKNFGIKEGTGYDLNMFAILFGKFLNKIKKVDNISLINSNFKAADLKKYDFVYMYLFPKTMKEFEEWVFNNISENTIIISNSFQFDKHQPYETLNTDAGKSRFYFYKK